MTNIILTGASRGIGLETLKAFLSLPHLKAGLIARDEAQLNSLAAQYARSDRALIPFPFDFSRDPEQLEKLSGQISEHFDRVDILINNAGMLLKKPFEAFDAGDYETLFRVNFFAPALLIKLLLPLLRKSDIRHVINIGSMGGFQGSGRFPGMSLYSASKGALANLTESLAAEYAEAGIRFNCLALGAVQTDMLKGAFPGYTAPVGPGDMGRYIRDFSLNSWRFINGKIIPVSLSTP